MYQNIDLYLLKTLRDVFHRYQPPQIFFEAAKLKKSLKTADFKCPPYFEKWNEILKIHENHREKYFFLIRRGSGIRFGDLQGGSKRGFF